MTDRTEITPRDALDTAVRFWWVLVVFMLLGSLVGWIIHQLQPPLYEVRAEFSVQIDYARTGALTEYQQDQVLKNVIEIIYSYEHINQVQSSAVARGLNVDYSKLIKYSSMERQFSTLILRVKFTDPKIATDLVNTWSQAAITTLDEAYQHAIEAHRLLTEINALSSCLEQSITANPANPYCGYPNQGDFSTRLAALDEDYRQEKLASMNLFPGISVYLQKAGEPPVKPDSFGLNTMMLAGLAIGLLLGLIVIQFLPNCLRRSSDGR